MANWDNKDKQLERFGLLNYQTKDLSAQEIADRYSKFDAYSGYQVDPNWFEEQYGSRYST